MKLRNCCLRYAKNKDPLKKGGKVHYHAKRERCHLLVMTSSWSFTECIGRRKISIIQLKATDYYLQFYFVIFGRWEISKNKKKYIDVSLKIAIGVHIKAAPKCLNGPQVNKEKTMAKRSIFSTLLGEIRC